MDDKKLKEKISNLLYKSLNYMYCDNCRFGLEITEEEAKKECIAWGCEDCHRKSNGWAISRNCCDVLATIIIEIIKKGE